MSEENAAPLVLDEQPKIPEVLPVLPLRDIVVYPYVILPLSVSREKSIKAVDTALVENRMILLLTQRQVEMDEPGPEDLHRVGTAALIMRVLKLPVEVREDLADAVEATGLSGRPPTFSAKST